jgi:hypothetical protein
MREKHHAQIDFMASVRWAHLPLIQSKAPVWLSDDAVLRKGGRRVELADFAVGDWVKITWKGFERSSIVEGLEAK